MKTHPLPVLPLEWEEVGDKEISIGIEQGVWEKGSVLGGIRGTRPLRSKVREFQGTNFPFEEKGLQALIVGSPADKNRKFPGWPVKIQRVHRPIRPCLPGRLPPLMFSLRDKLSDNQAGRLRTLSLAEASELRTEQVSDRIALFLLFGPLF